MTTLFFDTIRVININMLLAKYIYVSDSDSDSDCKLLATNLNS